jgi:hypothetical protein
MEQQAAMLHGTFPPYAVSETAGLTSEQQEFLL